MNLPNKPEVITAVYNSISNTKMFTVKIDIPYVLLPEFLQFKELTVTYEKLENIRLEEVYNNPFIPTWTKQQGVDNEILETNEVRQSNDFWLNNLDTLGESTSFEGEFVPLEQMGWQTLVDNYNNLLKLSISKQHANLLLAPFAYTTCIISGVDWNTFFERFCPNYQCIDGEYYKSKKEWWFFARLYQGYGSENIQEPSWEEINYSKSLLDLQQIAEIIYELYQKTDWKESNGN